MGDALEVAPGARGLELEAERVRGNVLEVMRFVHDDVRGLGKKSAAAPRVVHEERVVHDHEARLRGGAPRLLEVAAAARRRAAPARAGLVVRGDARPEGALAAEEVDLRPVAARRRGPPDERLQPEARLLARRDLRAEELPAARAE